MMELSKSRMQSASYFTVNVCVCVHVTVNVCMCVHVHLETRYQLVVVILRNCPYCFLRRPLIGLELIPSARVGTASDITGSHATTSFSYRF